MHEAACFDSFHACACQPPYKLDLCLGRYARLLVLQPISRPDLNDPDMICQCSSAGREAPLAGVVEAPGEAAGEEGGHGG